MIPSLLRTSVALSLLFLSSHRQPALAQEATSRSTAEWMQRERAFFEDGPALLLTQPERDRLSSLPAGERRRAIEAFLARDPLPATPENELATAIAGRQRLGFEGQAPTGDARFALRFLHGAPSAVQRIDCGDVFVPSEVWTLPTPGGDRRVLLFRRPGQSALQLWRPADGKHALYTERLRYWLSAQPERWDVKMCKEAKLIDQVTGISGLGGPAGRGGSDGAKAAAGAGAPNALDPGDLLEPPRDLAAWVARASAGGGPPAGDPLLVSSVRTQFPTRDGSRMVTEIAIELPPGAVATVSAGADRADAGDGAAGAERPAGPAGAALVRRLSAHGFLERDGEVFDDFRLRFHLPAANADEATVAVIERHLRPGERFVARFDLRDEVSGREVRIAHAFVVPSEPQPGATPRAASTAPAAASAPPSERPNVALGADSIALLPPTADAVAVTWRTTALTTGTRIRKVAFFVDGELQLTVGRAPFSAELRLTPLPTEQLVRADGLDEQGRMVATSELLLNPQGGRVGIRIVEPATAVGAATVAKVRLAVTVPTGRVVRGVELRLNEKPVATLQSAPWETVLRLPAEELVFLVAEVTLDDGTGASTTRTLRSSGYVDEVSVESIELYVAALDSSGQMVRDLRSSEVAVREAGRAQTIQRFEWVKTLPLRLGLVIDASGSMSSSLAEAQSAAEAFLRGVMKPGDQAFLASFSARPTLDMPLTDDTGALVFALDGLRAGGPTALHDALVQGLRQLAGTKGQRALVLLSDGDDNSSAIEFADALEYARRSGTAIYPIGLDLPMAAWGVHNKLEQLAKETGGRAFFARGAAELVDIYGTIEEELRSRYLIVYQRESNCAIEKSGCPLEVTLRKGLRARVTRVASGAAGAPPPVAR